jgi:hypothetical protein
MKTMLEQLLELGFAHMPMKEHFGDDPPARFRYLYRKFENNHQYVSLMYDYVTKLDSSMDCYGDFLEAVFEAYWFKKDTRKPKGSLPAREMEKKGWKPVHCTIYRDVKELTEAVSKEYQLSPEEKKKS